MEKDLVVCGTGGSSSGMKRMRADGNDDEPMWQLSLGAIYGGAAAPSTPKVDGDSCIAMGKALPVPHHSAVAAAAVNLPVSAVGAALFAAGAAQIASSLLDDGGNGASASVIASLPLIASSGIIVAPAAISLPVEQQPSAIWAAPPVLPIKQDVAPPRASTTARPAHRRRRTTNGSPNQPAAIIDANPPNSGTVSPAPTNGGGAAIPSPPFPWATNRVAIHHPISHLAALGITTIQGEVHCARCDLRKTISYNLAAKFTELRDFVYRNVHDMDDRAPAAWLDYTKKFLDCDGCGQSNSLRPVLPAEKEKINWVFLLLGQTLGMCTLDQLKYFCARTGQHRTGAKDRVLYLTYMELCNQLCPDRLFNLTAERQNRGQRYSL